MELTSRRSRTLRTTGLIVSTGIFLGLFYAFLSDGVGKLFPFLNSAIIGFLVGLSISFIELYILTRARFRKLRFLSIVLIRTTLYVITIVPIIFLELVLARMIKYDLSFLGVWNSEEFRTYLLEKDFLIAIIYTLVIAFSISITLQISRKMGQGVLWSFVTGTYYQPVQTERIFMFLNIKHSDQIIHTLGPLKFHNLLNDFIFDITEPILAYRGVIYQYVEDVLVVSWSIKHGFKNGNCIRTFFEAKQQIQRLSKSYYSKYDLVPQFQASFHCGTVIQGEIGTVKSEITFLGDVMNTSSRILNQCNPLDQELLLSAKMIEELELPITYTSRTCGEVKLRGKSKPLEVYSISELDAGKNTSPKTAP